MKPLSGKALYYVVIHQIQQGHCTLDDLADVLLLSPLQIEKLCQGMKNIGWLRSLGYGGQKVFVATPDALANYRSFVDFFQNTTPETKK